MDPYPVSAWSLIKFSSEQNEPLYNQDELEINKAYISLKSRNKSKDTKNLHLVPHQSIRDSVILPLN